MKESVKLDKGVVSRVRARVKKTKHTIGGFFELAAEQLLADYKRIEISEKAIQKNGKV